MQRSYLSHVIQFYFHYTYAVGFYSFLFFYALFIISMRFKKYGFDRSLIGYHIALIFIWLFSVFRYLVTFISIVLILFKDLFILSLIGKVTKPQVGDYIVSELGINLMIH